MALRFDGGVEEKSLGEEVRRRRGGGRRRESIVGHLVVIHGVTMNQVRTDIVRRKGWGLIGMEDI